MAKGLCTEGRVTHQADADKWIDHRIVVERVSGGANNALYQVESDGRVYACKLCVVDERRRAAREWEAMRLMLAFVNPSRAVERT